MRGFGPDHTTRWKAITPQTIKDLASNGRLATHRLRVYMDEGMVTQEDILGCIDFSDPNQATHVLKKYYGVLFLHQKA